MEIETARVLLSALLTAIPTVMSIYIIVFFAFPRSKENWIRKRHKDIYHYFLLFLILLVVLSSISVLNNFNLLRDIDKIYSVYQDTYLLDIGLNFSIIILILFPIFLLCYLLVLAYIENKR